MKISHLLFSTILLFHFGCNAPEEVISEETSEQSSEISLEEHALVTARLTGSWSANTSEMATTNSEELTEEQRIQNEMLSAMTITITFNEDGTQTSHAMLMGQEENKEGTWEILSVNGDSYRIDLNDEHGGSSGELVFIDDDHFNLIEANNPESSTTIPFERQES